jgi:hypothetical protein
MKLRKTIACALAGAVVCASVSAAPAGAEPETVAGGYQIDMSNIPSVRFDAHPDWETLYNTAWNTHKSNIKKATAALNPEDVYYVDEAFDNTIFQWDTLFMMMFDKYGYHEFPTLQSMDNFYYHQIDSEAGLGYIPRRISESNGSAWHSYTSLDGNNPPLFGWAEWEQYLVHGDAARFSKVIRGKTILQRLDENFQYNKRQWITSIGLYKSNGQGNGMDNTPDQNGANQSSVDMSFQQYLYAHYIKKIADAAGDAAEAAKYQAEMDELRPKLQQLWNDSAGIFMSLRNDTAFSGVVTPADFWSMASGAATPEQADSMVRNYALNSEKMFRPQGLSTVAYDYPSFKPTGGYWNGAFWSPTSYQYIKGLELYGYDDIAFQEAVRHVNALARVCINGAYDRYGSFLHTLWENYSSEWDVPGSTESSDAEPSRSNFVGWTGALAIGAIIEDIVGVTPNAPENTVNWSLRLAEGFGIDNLWMKGNAISLSSAPRLTAKSAATITVTAQQPFTLKVKNNGQTTTFSAPAGTAVFSVPGEDDGEGGQLSGKTGPMSGYDPTASDSYVTFAGTANSEIKDGLKNQSGNNASGGIYNINTIGYRNSAVRQSAALPGYEYVKSGVNDGFMVMAKADGALSTLKLALGVKNATAKITAQLSDGSAPDYVRTVTAGASENTVLVELPYRASGAGNYIIVKYTITEMAAGGEASLKAVSLDEGGSAVPAAPTGLTLTPGDRSLKATADAQPAFDSYNIYYGADPSGLAGPISVASLPARIADLANFTRYYVAIAGVLGGVESDMSEIASEVPGAAGLSPAERALDDWDAVKSIVLNGSADFGHITGNLKFDGVSGPIYGSAFSFAVTPNAAGNGVLPGGAVVRPTLPQSDASNNITVTITCEGVSVTVVQKALTLAADPDVVPYASGQKTVTGGTINLTAEGSTDWVQFKSNSLSNIARKNTAAPSITNLGVIGSINGSPGDAPFSFSYDGSDVLNGNNPTSRKGIETKGTNTGFTFDLPYRSGDMQTLNVYTSVWGGEVALEFSINGGVVYRDTLTKNTDSGLLGQGFEIHYRLPDSTYSASVRLIVTQDFSPQYHVSNTLQAVTLSESDERPPVAPMPDEDFYIAAADQPARVDLTAEGTKDWKLFNTTSLPGIEKKSGGSGIGNIAPLNSVTKMNPNSATATFVYSDGTNSASGSHSYGIVFEKANNGLSFTLPFSANPQTMNVYYGAWSALTELKCEVIDGSGNVIKTATSTFDTGAQAGGTAAKYGAFRLNYKLDSPDQHVRATIKAAAAYDATWGNISVQAVTLAEPLLEVSIGENIAGGTIRVAPNMIGAGGTVSVYARPDDGYRLLDGSLKYALAGGGETPISGGSFTMPGENVTVTGVFVQKRDISIDSRVTIEPISAPAPGGDYNPVFEISARGEVSVNAIVAAYSGGRLAAMDSQRLTLDGDCARTSISLAAVPGAEYKFFFWDDAYKPLTAITSIDG